MNTASKVNKTLGECVKAGDRVLTHACLIDRHSKVAYLATCVWLEQNSAFSNPVTRPIPILRKDIHQQKIDIYKNVVLSISASLATPNDAFEAPNDGIDIDDLVLWQKGQVKAVFFDHKWKKNGSLIGGIMQVHGYGFAFFLSKNFVKADSVPSIGMEEYVNIYPTYKLPNAAKLGGFSHICTALYPVYMRPDSVVGSSTISIRPIINDSAEMLEQVVQTVPLTDIEQFLR